MKNHPINKKINKKTITKKKKQIEKKIAPRQAKN